MKKILVIEDETQTRNICVESLEAEGFNVIAAESAYSALQMVQEYLPDLVICNIVHPGFNSYEFLNKLRHNPATAIVPVIFITAKDSKTELRKYMELGADDYLIKPFTVEELKRAIAARLKRQDTLKQWYVAKSQLVKESSTSQSLFPSIPKLTQCFNFIEANYHQQITLSDIASSVGYSPAYLTDLMRRQTGQSVCKWVVKRRMVEACRLLKVTNHSVNKIASSVGYLDTNHFIRQFRQWNGITPQAWRQVHGS